MTLRTSSRLPRILAAGIVSLRLLTGALSAQAPTKQEPAKQEPFRLNNVLGGPSYLKVSGSERLRYEGLNGQYRNSTTRDNEDQIFSRFLLRADYTRDQWGATIEGIDARAWNTKANSFADNTTVNTFDLLQAYVSYQPAEGHTVLVGRYTMDIGSRRMSARNEYRNTINSFNGARWDFAGKDGYSAGAFWGMPTDRRPSSRTMLVDNEHDWDTQTIDYQFYGLHSTQQIDERATAQFYVLQLSDHRDSVTSRDLTTAGFRLFAPAERGKLFGEVEAAYQFGGRGTADVHAYFVHASAGKTWDHDWRPTIRFALDIASGNDSNDPDFNRFDTLFGARRFEYGPTGIYGTIGRRNLVSPEIRISVNPTKNTWILVAARDFRLASQSDGWREAGDTTGTSSDVGQQVECRLRWDAIPKSVRFEGGAAYMSGGQFRETSTIGRSVDTRYFFFETIFTF